MSRTKRGSATSRARRKAAASASALGKAEPAPPMAELRRRATRRLRAVARLRALVEREYRVAAEECERLRAAWPAEAIPAEARAAAPEQAGRTGGGSGREEGRREPLQLEALQAEAEATRASSDGSNESMTGLLGFLEELSAILSPHQDAPADVRPMK